MKRSRKDSNPIDHEEPKVIAATNVTGPGSISRRDFLKVSTTTLATIAAGPLLASCSPPVPVPTSTPAPPSGTINNDNTPLLDFPGDIVNVVVLLAAGTAIEARRRDSSRTWVEVRVKEGENAGKVGWVQMVEVSFSSNINIEAAIPISNDVSAISTVEAKVDGEVRYFESFYTFPGETQPSGNVSQGDPVEILERDSTDTWFKIRRSNGEVGWIQQAAIKASPGYATKIRINYAVIPIPPSSSGGDSSNPPGGGGGGVLTYYYPN
jgi:SH3-like domain-containing protein